MTGRAHLDILRSRGSSDALIRTGERHSTFVTSHRPSYVLRCLFNHGSPPPLQACTRTGRPLSGGLHRPSSGDIWSVGCRRHDHGFTHPYGLQDSNQAMRPCTTATRARCSPSTLPPSSTARPCLWRRRHHQPGSCRPDLTQSGFGSVPVQFGQPRRRTGVRRGAPIASGGE